MRKLRFFAIALLMLAFAAVASLNAQKYSVLHNFGSKSGDPSNPSYSGIVAQGRDGNMYSTAPRGGAAGYGAVFKITPAGVLTTLYSFTGGTDGAAPYGGLTLGTDGNFYGTTSSGGKSGYGTVFKITPGGSLTVIHNFTNASDGGTSYAPPVQGTDGNFYGTTTGGGETAGWGVVFKVTPSGSKFTPLYQFDFTHGAYPYAPLVQGTDGNFYGTTENGSINIGCGVIFKMTTTGKFTVFYNFDGPQGCAPYSPLVQGSDGNFYGTTEMGGGCGDVFKVTPSGTITVLHIINCSTDGYDPYAGLVQATDSNFYGVNSGGGTLGYGTIFKITPKSIYSVLYNFDSTTGATPYVTPFQHTNGIVYGDTESGGTGNVSPCTTGSCGVFYSLHVTGLTPFVSLLPYSAKVGATIEFLGQGFTSKTAVSFNGTPAPTPKGVTATYLTTTVPNGAITGLVTVTTSGVTLKSNKIFRVIPQIRSFSPTSGPVGTVVTIYGESFQALPTGATSVYFFGGVKGTITSVSYTKIKAKVPSGAKTGTITVTTPGGKAVSSVVFTVT